MDQKKVSDTKDFDPNELSQTEHRNMFASAFKKSPLPFFGTLSSPL